jgi:hypothetical protein
VLGGGGREFGLWVGVLALVLDCRWDCRRGLAFERGNGCIDWRWKEIDRLDDTGEGVL